MNIFRRIRTAWYMWRHPLPPVEDDDRVFITRRINDYMVVPHELTGDVMRGGAR